MKTEDIDKKIGMPDVDEEWAKFEREVIGEETKPRKRVFMGWAVGIAASIALMAGIFLWVSDEEKQPDSSKKTAQATNVKVSEERNDTDGNAIKKDTTGNSLAEADAEIVRKDAPPRNLSAQTAPPTNEKTEEQTLALDNNTENVKIFTVVEQQPSFPGGNRALQEFIKQNLRYPPTAQAYGVSGRVIMQFVIDSLGYVSDIKHVKDFLKYDTLLLNRESETRQIQLKEQIARQLEEECTRVITLMPRWAPARMSGKVVSTKYDLPFLFQPAEFQKNASDSASPGTHQ